MSTKIALHMHHTLFSIFFHVRGTIRLANLLKLLGPKHIPLRFLLFSSIIFAAFEL